MREFDDVHKLIEEESQNPFEREALSDLVALLAEGPLAAAPEDAFRDGLRRRLVAEAAASQRRGRPWYRTPLGLSAAAAVALGLAAGGTFWGLENGRTGMLPPAASQVADAGGGPQDNVSTLVAPDQSEGNMGIASAVPEQSSPGTGAAATQPSLSAPAAGDVSRAMVRPAQRDGAMVRVEPGTATFTLEAALPAAKTELPSYRMTQVALTAAEVQAAARGLGLAGEVQQGFGHLWVGSPLEGQDTAVEGLPPYQQPGRWLVASPDWGNGWSYLYRDDTSAAGAAAPAATLSEAQTTFRSFLQKAGMPGADEADIAVRPGGDGTYWGDLRLRLAGTDVADAGGALRLDASGRITYASWPALSFTQTGTRSLQSPEEALVALRAMPFEWYKGDPKLTVTRVELVYRWPLLTSPGAEADVEPAYEFTVRDADGNQSVLYVSAWQ